MLVTRLEDYTNKRVKVYLDGELAFALYKSELRNFKISVDEDISEEVYDEIVDVLLTKRAKLRAMNLLKSRDYTEFMLRDKLRQGVYPDKVIDEAIDYCSSYGYIDDVRYASNYISYSQSSKSRRQIEQWLSTKGVSKEDIDVAFDLLGEADSLVDEIQLIEKHISKKHYDKENATYEERQKMMAALYRKGFSMENIQKVLR